MLRPIHPALLALEDVVRDLSSGAVRPADVVGDGPDSRNRAAALAALFAEGVVVDLQPEHVADLVRQFDAYA